MCLLYEDLLSIERKRSHEKIIDKNEDQENDHRADVKPPHFIWWDILSYGFEHGLGQVIQDDSDLVEGWNPDPGKDHTK
jgi:hypothetical protein